MPRRCGICRELGHNRQRCPRLPFLEWSCVRRWRASINRTSPDHDVYMRERHTLALRGVPPVEVVIADPTVNIFSSPAPTITLLEKAIALSKALNDTCTICTDNGCDSILDCNHHFHHDCIQHWIRVDRKSYRAAQCPICRRPINPYL